MFLGKVIVGIKYGLPSPSIEPVGQKLDMSGFVAVKMEVCIRVTFVERSLLKPIVFPQKLSVYLIALSFRAHMKGDQSSGKQAGTLHQQYSMTEVQWYHTSRYHRLKRLPSLPLNQIRV